MEDGAAKARSDQARATHQSPEHDAVVIPVELPKRPTITEHKSGAHEKQHQHQHANPTTSEQRVVKQYQPGTRDSEESLASSSCLSDKLQTTAEQRN